MWPWFFSVAVLIITIMAYKKLGAKQAVFLDGTRKFMTLIDITQISPDTKRMVFALDHRKQKLGLPVGHHLLLYGPNTSGVVEGKWYITAPGALRFNEPLYTLYIKHSQRLKNNRDDIEEGVSEISRKYTPVSKNHEEGKVELVVKEYKRNSSTFCDGGKMSQYLHSLPVGSQVAVEGPYGRIEYIGNGVFNVGKRFIKTKKVNLIAGGTGITPIFQLLRASLEDLNDKTSWSLIYANKTEEDVLLREELDNMVLTYSSRLKREYTVDKASSSWKFSQGFISSDMIEAHLFNSNSEIVVTCCCGPPPMIDSVKNILKSIGYNPENILTF